MSAGSGRAPRLSTPWWCVEPFDGDAGGPQIIPGWSPSLVVLRWWGLQRPRPQTARVRLTGPVESGVWTVTASSSRGGATVQREPADVQAQKVRP